VKLDTGRSSAGWSSYGCFRKCPRKFAYENRNSVEGKRGGARGLGTLVHALLAHHYLGWQGRTPEEVAEEVANESGVDSEDRELALQLYRKYAAHYAHGNWEAIAVEEEHKIGFLYAGDRINVVPHGTEGSVPYTARIDLVARDSAGKVWIVDHKTAAKIRGNEKTRYGLSGQMHGLHWIGRFYYGPAFKGVMLNLVQTRAGTRFTRVRPVAAPKMVEEFPKLIVQTAGEIAKLDSWAASVNDWPTSNNETVCISTYGLCDHAERCRFGV
jgi:hypothetical protein